jgi:hypothetical protein
MRRPRPTLPRIAQPTRRGGFSILEVDRTQAEAPCSNERTARHEAGHAIVALHYAVPFEHVRVVADEELLGAVRGFASNNSITNAVFLMAGAAGEQIERKRPKLTFAEVLRCGAQRDYEAAFEIASRREPFDCVEPFIDECFLAAHAIFVEQRADHERLRRRGDRRDGTGAFQGGGFGAE